MRQITTIKELLTQISENYTNPKALNSYVNNQWQHYSTQQAMLEVKYLALALNKLGVKKGDKVALMAVPSARWSIADLAIIAAGGVTVPLFPNISEENFLFIMNQADLELAFISGIDPWNRFHAEKNLFKKGLSLDDTDEEEDKVLSYQYLWAMGQKADAEDPTLYQRLLDAAESSDLATIIYTSGSTGIPKGAEHTHRSIFSLLHVDFFHWDWHTDSYLSVLPLAHVFSRTVNYIMIAWGISVYYYNDLKMLAAACREVHPTIMIVVPRLLEKVYSKMIANIQSAPYLKRAIGQWAFNMANQEEETTWKHLFHPLAEKLVYSHLREALGGHLRVVLSGGAALNPHLLHFFLDIGVPIYEGWGLTEACPVTVNHLNHVKVGTIGPAIDGLTVKASPEGELLVHGPLVMRGYYKNPEETAKAIDKEGWLHTGDRGSVDADGYVTILGRIKELFKTSNGKMIAPIPIEQALCKAPFIEMAMVIAEDRKFPSCLIVPNFEILHSLKLDKKMSDLSDEEFIHSPYIDQEMQKLLKQVNEHLNHWEQIRAYRFIPHELSIDKGELTPSMKIVRSVIEKKYKGLIDSIYHEETV